MGMLRTGRRYEIIFGPKPDQLSSADANIIDEAFAQVFRQDSNAVALTTATDRLRVIGSDMRTAIEAGRAICSIHCRVFDRDSNQELSSPLEIARRAVLPAQIAAVPQFDARSAMRKSRNFKMPRRHSATHH